MLELLHAVRPMVLSLAGDSTIYANLTYPGKRTYVEIRLSAEGSIMSVQIISPENVRRLIYRPDNKNSLLFSGRSFFEDNERLPQCLFSSRKLYDRIERFLISDKVGQVLERFEVAARRPDFNEDLLRHIQQQDAALDVTKVGFFVNGDDIDVFDDAALAEIDVAVTSSKIAEESYVDRYEDKKHWRR